MSCRRYRQEVAARAAGSQPDASVEAHVASCARCRQQADALLRLDRELERAFGPVRSISASPELARRARASAREAEVRPALGMTWWLPATAGCAVAVLLAVNMPGDVGLRPSPAAARTERTPPARSTPQVPTQARPERAAPRGAAPPAVPAARLTRARPAVAAAPEVLVPPSQARAIARLREMARQGLVVPNDDRERRPDAGPDALEVRALAVDLLEAPVETFLPQADGASKEH